MIRLQPLFIVTFLCVHAFGQALIKEVKEVSPSKETYLFPSVSIPHDNIAASDKINAELLKDFLQIERKDVKKSIFENVWATEPVVRLQNISYKVIFNGKGLLTISLSALGCGAYCESFTRYYCFNTKTGNKIFLDSLLGAAGQSRLSDSLYIKKKARLEAKISELRNKLKEVNATKDSKEEYTDGLDLYENCLREIDKPDLRYVDFYITNANIFVSLDRCSAHANRNLDDLDRFDFVFNVTLWEKLMKKGAMELLKAK